MRIQIGIAVMHLTSLATMAGVNYGYQWWHNPDLPCWWLANVLTMFQAVAVLCCWLCTFILVRRWIGAVHAELNKLLERATNGNQERPRQL